MARVYALGSNGSGQLGIGHLEDVSVPQEVLFHDQRPDMVTQVKAGGNHTLLLSSSAMLWYSGASASGACGLLEHTDFPKSRFRSVNRALDNLLPSSNTVFCACTWDASIIVQKDDNGKATRIYSFGTGLKGELGLGESILQSSKAQLIHNFPPEGLEIVELAACVSHVIAVLSNGDVYGWGNGRKGQLGERKDLIYCPHKITDLDFKVVRAVCGREFTYLLGEPGDGQHIVLGSNKWNVKTQGPSKAPRWMDVGANWCSIFVLLNDGRLISWGRDDRGQLGPSNLPKLSQIAIGSEHALGLTEEGEELLAWGWGEHGNCGPDTVNGDVKGKWNVIASSKDLPQGRRVSRIGAGCATSWLCISD